MEAPVSTVMEFPPDWDAVVGSWGACLAFLQKEGLDRDLSHTLSMVAQELLENAVKYGRFADPGDRIELELRIRPRSITVEVRSPVDERGSGLAHLDGTIQWIRGFQDPFEAYVEKLKRVAAQPYTPGVSGLGLARIAYEAGCLLDFYVDEGDVLSMSAVYRRNRKALTP